MLGLEDARQWQKIYISSNISNPGPGLITLFRGEEVWFGVGTFGTEDDVMRGLGNCYRLQLYNTEHLALFSKIFRHGCHSTINKQRWSKKCQVKFFSPRGPSWSESRHVRLFVCVSVECPLPMRFFSRPIIGPQITWLDPGLSLVNPPSLPYGVPKFDLDLNLE